MNHHKKRAHPSMSSLILIRNTKYNYNTNKRLSVQYAFLFPCGIKICSI